MPDAFSIRSDQTKLTLSISTGALSFGIALLLTEKSIHDRFAVQTGLGLVILSGSIVFAVLALMRIGKLVGGAAPDPNDLTLERYAGWHVGLLAIGLLAVVVIFVSNLFGSPYVASTADQAVAIAMRRIGSPALVSKGTVSQILSVDSHSERATWLVRIELKSRSAKSNASAIASPTGYDFFIDAATGRVTCELGAGSCGVANP